MLLRFSLLLTILCFCSAQEEFSKCGQSSRAAVTSFPPEIATRIAAAIDTSSDPIGTWPWMASLGYVQDSEWKHLCGSVIITQQFVLTAAHCVLGSGRLFLRLGDKDLNSPIDDFGANTREVDQVTIHPKYNENAYYDIAVLKVHLSIEYSRFIRPICMSEVTNDLDEYAGHFVTVTGWGISTRNSADGGEILRSVPIRVFSQGTCNKTHSDNISPGQQLEISESLSQLFTPNILCAGYERGLYGPCKGDSGSPLVVYQEDLAQYVLLGLVQGGIGSCGDQDFPAIFTRIDAEEIHSFITKAAGLSTSQSEATLHSQNSQLVWGEWSSFSHCSASCGGGIKTRTRTCASIGSCPFPVTEESTCNEEKCPTPDKSKGTREMLLIAGGTATTAEVLGLNDEPISCPDFVQPLPVEDAEWSSFFKHKGDPVFCSTFQNYSRIECVEIPKGFRCSPKTDASPCFKFNASSKSWERFTQLTRRRLGALTLAIDDYVQIAGGWDGDNLLSTDIWDSVREEFILGPQLPFAAQAGCIVAINQTHAILTGGFEGEHMHTNKAYMFDRETQQWTSLDPMKEERSYHACGLVGDSKVVVAGGYNGPRDLIDPDKYLSSVETYDLRTQTWTAGPELPLKISHATSVQARDTFLMVGGSTPRRRLNTVYEYDEASNSWILRRQKMKDSRDAHPAVWRLPKSFFNCR